MYTKSLYQFLKAHKGEVLIYEHFSERVCLKAGYYPALTEPAHPDLDFAELVLLEGRGQVKATAWKERDPNAPPWGGGPAKMAIEYVIL